MRTNIKINDLIAVCNGTLPINTIVGNRKDEFGTFYVAYVATEKGTGAVKYTANGSVSLNWRKSLRQSDARTMTPGQKLPATQPQVLLAPVDVTPEENALAEQFLGALEADLPF